MVDRRKIAVDVAAQDVGVAVAIALVGLDSAMRTLADPIGEGVVDEAGLEDRLDDRTEGMMHDAVAERRGRNDASFRIVDFEGDVAARPIFAVAKLPLQGEKLALQIGEERGRAGLLALAFDRPTGSGVQRLEIGDPTEQMLMPSRHSFDPPLRCSRRCAPSSSRRSGVRSRRACARHARSGADPAISGRRRVRSKKRSFSIPRFARPQMLRALPGVGGLDQRFEHVERDGLDAVADGELVAFREFLDRRHEPRQDVNAGVKIPRFAGEKIHQCCWQEGPELGTFS